MKEKSRSTEIKIVVDAKDNNVDCVATVNVGSIDLDTTIELLQICIDELTNLFILAGSLFLLFIGYLAYQLASTEKGTRNLLLFFVVCILIFIFSIHFLMYRFENASEAQPKIIEKYEIVRGKTEQLIQGKGFGLLTVYNMSLSENNQFGFYYYNQDGDIERMSINFDDIKIKEVEEDTARLEVYVEQETNTYCSVLLGCETETKPISNEQYMLIVPKGTITGSDELVFE